MIDPRDIFDAHRVVQAPSQYRGKRITRPILPTGAIRNAERRRAIGYVIADKVRSRARTVRQTVVRSVAPRIRKR